jgi:hypothetical protein
VQEEQSEICDDITSRCTSLVENVQEQYHKNMGLGFMVSGLGLSSEDVIRTCFQIYNHCLVTFFPGYLQRELVEVV